MGEVDAAPELVGWVVELRSNLRRMIERLRHQHRREREKLDLELETSPIEGSFSPALLDLMNREEAAGAQGRFEAREQVANRVDTAMAAETNKHFATQSDINQRRWMALFRHQVLERNQFTQELNEKLLRFCREIQLSPPDDQALKQNPLAFPMSEEETLSEEFAVEERRIFREMQTNMGANERFHLENAFRLQLTRVDAEWATHEAQMNQDYQAQRAEIEGRHVQKKVVQSPTGPWKSKEKQSRLIHTAPVIQPNASPVRNRVANSPMDKELQALDRAFRDAKEQTAFQKQNAMRWIRRQSQRMNIQLKFVEKGKHLLAQHLEREEIQLQEAVGRVERFVAWMAAQKNLPPTVDPNLIAGCARRGSLQSAGRVRRGSAGSLGKGTGKGSSYYSKPGGLPAVVTRAS